ncbi:MAG: hypothetical protein ACI4EV_08320 [Lachnospiraceae bacterium]
MKKKTIIRIVYVCVFLVISLIPLFAFNAGQKTIGNETKVTKPELVTDKGLNMNYFSDMDSYFSQNFGLRNNLVWAGNSLKAALFGVSGNSSVIVGNEGWLFYESALNDFVGREVLSDVEIEKIAIELEIAADYVRSLGKQFIFTVAPNKMSVYGEYMPYNYIKTKTPGNYEKLFSELKNYDLVSIDLKTALINNKNTFDTVIYHKKDSHWNNLGAAIAYETIMAGIEDVQTKEYTKAGFGTVNEFKGDLESMLFPGSTSLDQQVKFNIFDGIVYGENFKSSEDLKFSTTNTLAVNNKKVVLYRDSFGNALYWFFANDFGNALIKREIPYNIYADAQENDILVAEIVERNIGNLIKNPPVAPSFKMNADDGSFRTRDGKVIVDVYGNSGDLKDIDDTVNCFGSIKQQGLYEITFNNEKLKEYAYIYLMIFDSENGITMYQTMPAGKDCEATIYLETNDYSYVTEHNSSAYVIAVSKDGQDIRIPAKFTLQD